MNNRIVSKEDWLAARKALLAEEKALKRRQDELAEKRRAMPVTRIEKPYAFRTEDGPASLADLFEGRRQLVIYHFMFGEDWAEGCPSCSFWADHFGGIVSHLKARDTSFACVSSASLDKLLAYRARLGWSFPWVSSNGTQFGEDFGVFFHEDGDHPDGYNYSGRPAKGELPGLSVFLQGDDGAVLHSYSAYSRGLEPLNTVYAVLDMTPLGRREDDLSYPMAWVKRRDQYRL
ncbi:MAG: DUF899 domain-containing protein [Pseudomonadota bacterium]